ncbi:MAG: DUF58 domain-containing protein [Planctomycetes bacterium]|nr:DUF58 domain-containing protein [Planctomycetota bacterium]
MSAYLDPQILAKIGRLDLKAKYVVEGFIAGMHKSPYKGFSVEFAQHRGYVPGDDLKHLDWRVYAKSERLSIKQYEAETNLVTTILTDASASMAYVSPRTRGASAKLEYAKLMTASLAYLVLGQSDAVSVAIFDQELQEFIPRSTRKVHINRICAALDNATPQNKTGVGRIMHTMAERVRRRGVFVVISDLFDNVEDVLSGIQHLRHDGHEVVLLHLLDRDELDFPFEGMVQFKGLELGEQVLCHPRMVKKAYLDELHKFLTRVKAACTRNGADYVQISTDTPVDVALSAYLGSRERMMLSGGRGPGR